MFLGRGTYGSVRVKGELAVKKFHDIRHLIQEYLAGSYLDNARNIVRIHDVDLLKMKLGMELYQMNLRHWMEDNFDREKLNDRYFILHEILVGLCEIHGRGLVHGDIKPGNILLNDKPLKVAIGDLGFVSLRRYAKVRYIAKVYRDSVIRQSYVHDMWSLGVLMLELFGHIKIVEICSSHEIEKIARRKVKDKKLQDIIIQLTGEEPSSRLTAAEVLHILFKESVSVQFKTIPEGKIITQCSNAFVFMRKYGSKYKLAMIERCIEALKWYIQTHDIEIDDCVPYGIVMLLISSSLYRISHFTIDKALNYSGLSRDDFLFYLCRILANDDIITILLKN